jgi:hypothetical protein
MFGRPHLRGRASDIFAQLGSHQICEHFTEIFYESLAEHSPTRPSVVIIVLHYYSEEKLLYCSLVQWTGKGKINVC